MGEVRKSFAAEMARRLRAARSNLVKIWLERIAEQAALDKQDVFPGRDVVDHVPLLIDGVAAYVEDPSLQISAQTPVIAKAIELGRLRYEQGYSAREILKEYEFLGNVLFDYLVKEVDDIDMSIARAELLTCGHRVYHSIAVIQQHTTSEFLSLDEQRVREREDRLSGFNRMVTHELKNRVGAAENAAQLLKDKGADQTPEEQERFAGMVAKNLETIGRILEDLDRFSRVYQEGVLSERYEPLPDIVTRVLEELRDFTETRRVRVEVASNLHAILVPAAAVELALRNLVTNAAKYRTQSGKEPWVRIESALNTDQDKCDLTVRVSDNGLGVPEDVREKVFQRFFRAHERVCEETGSGLGLSIVQETIKPVGGRVWAEFPQQGSIFAFTVPCADADHGPKRVIEPERGERGRAAA
jgi:signal transduction histidine kinase